MNAATEFKHINPELYRHPEEREARDRLKKIPGFARALEIMLHGPICKAERQAEVASMARVGTGVYPVLAGMWNGILERFGVKPAPLFIAFEAAYPWSIQGGKENPSLILDGKYLDILNAKEMEALLAGQAGSIRLGNADYLAAADFVRQLTDFSGIAGAPAAVLAWGLENWRRRATFSADRAAALAMGDPGGVTALLDRISGAGNGTWGGIADPGSLRLQGIEALSLDRDWANDRWLRFAMAMNRRNQSGLIRRLDLLDWFAGGDPARILAGQIQDIPDVKAAGDSEDESLPRTGEDSDPGLAFWGEFAGGQTGSRAAGECPFPKNPNTRCPMAEVMGMAEKGWNGFWKAGEAFLRTFQDKDQ